MPVRSVHHIGVVVQDLERAREFFVAIGLLLEGEDEVRGDWTGAVMGLEGVHSRVAFLRAPGSDTALELTQFLTPESPAAAATASAPSAAPRA